MHDYPFSDEQLGAYIDKQLTAKEYAAITAAMQQDPHLSRRVGELQELKAWVRLSYRAPPPLPTEIKTAPLLSRRVQAIAVAILVFVGGVTGWWIHGPAHHGAGFYDLSQTRAIADSNKVLVHISKMDPQRITRALDEVEQLLQDSKRHKRPLQVEVVANAGGLALLRDGSPFGKRIASLASRYDNVAFLACGIAIQNARLSEGIDEVKLLPQAKPIDAALEEIVRRLKAGWTYVR